MHRLWGRTSRPRCGRETARRGGDGCSVATLGPQASGWSSRRRTAPSRRRRPKRWSRRPFASSGSTARATRSTPSATSCGSRRGDPRARGRREQATAERLIAEGRMMEPGLAALERAKADGSWTRLDASHPSPRPPRPPGRGQGATTMRCGTSTRSRVDAEGHPRVDRRDQTSGDPRRPHGRDRPGRRTTTSASTSGGAIARSAGPNIMLRASCSASAWR